jgi:hypothetical protein
MILGYGTIRYRAERRCKPHNNLVILNRVEETDRLPRRPIVVTKAPNIPPVVAI